MSDPVIIRAMVPGDLAYVFATWLRDLRDADSSGLPDDLWFPPHRALVERILADRSVVALVAAAADAPTEILGYVVAEPGEVLEWIHVRKPLRRKGLANRLLAAAQMPTDQRIQARWVTPVAKWLGVGLASRKLRRERPRIPVPPSTASRSAS